MKSTKVQKYILYSLGKWFEEANKKIGDNPLQVSISKSVFIDLMKRAEIAQKQERALYKNLEILEEKKLIEYANKELNLTKKGIRLCKEISKECNNYFKLIKKMQEKDPASYTKKIQTVFRD